MVAETVKAETESVAIRRFLFFKIDVRGSEALGFQDAYEHVLLRCRRETRAAF